MEFNCQAQKWEIQTSCVTQIVKHSLWIDFYQQKQLQFAFN